MLRAAVPRGTVFLAEGTHDQPANALTEAVVAVRRVAGAAGPVATGFPAQVQPAAEGLAEAPASAPLDIPPTAGGDKTTGGSTSEGRGR